MEDLLVGSISRSTNLTGVHNSAQILYMRENDICRFAIELMVLTSAYWGNVRGNTGVDDNVLFSGMLRHWKTTKNFESPAIVNIVGNLAQGGVEIGEGESLLVEKAKRFIQSFILSVKTMRLCFWLTNT